MSGQDLSTVRAGTSLILGNGEQLPLIDVDEAGLPAGAYASLEQRGRFTGERLFSGNPQLYHAVAKLLGRGQMSYREIAEVCQISVNTVCGIAYRESLPIETIRERLSRIGFDVTRLSLEALRDLLADPERRKQVSAKDLAIISGIGTQNSQLMSGGATARFNDEQVSPPSHDDYLKAIRNVTPTGSGPGTPAAKESAPAQVIDLPAEPHTEK